MACLPVAIIVHSVPAALYCTSLMVSKTLSARNHRTQAGTGKRKVNLSRNTLASQLAMMQSLQPNTLWLTVCIPVFNSQFHFSWQTHSTLFQPHSSCPAYTFDKIKKGEKITFIESLVWGLNPCHWTKGWLGTLWSWRDPSKKRWMKKQGRGFSVGR